jgi:hypothetical protein
LVGSLKSYQTKLTGQQAAEKKVREKEAEKKKMVDAEKKAAQFKMRFTGVTN